MKYFLFSLFLHGIGFVVFLKEKQSVNLIKVHLSTKINSQLASQNIPKTKAYTVEHAASEPASNSLQYLPKLPWSECRPKPEYPIMARRNDMEDDLELKIFSNDMGYVTDVQILKPSKFDFFNEAAIKALKSWRISARSEEIVPVQFRIIK